ncbi:cyclin-dependent kinase inhibitor 1-like [Musa acuminata AAA Group]|uniref:cyclin-dependent kinase inhibitor 1-like n=1 Tax=Musa acuminata AAA Group TaxID=214697 RepID=UPI0031DFEF3F
MGKYTRKCSRGVEKLSVMEVTQVVGVRRRARVPAVAVAADAASARSSKRRKTAPQRTTEVVQTSSYLQLRSRRLFMTFRRPRLLAANSAAYSTGPAVEGVSRCSSNVSGDVVVDEQEGEGLERLTCNFGSRRARETTPSRDPRREASDRKSTTATSTSRTKTEVEIEEFFAAAEREQAQRFAVEYNYDVIGDVPLDGRFEWVRILR